jgi:hypothetical protein
VIFEIWKWHSEFKLAAAAGSPPGIEIEAAQA